MGESQYEDLISICLNFHPIPLGERDSEFDENVTLRRVAQPPP